MTAICTDRRSTEPVKYPIKGKSVFWGLWSYLDIPSTVNRQFVYLRRLRVIQTPLFALYVHRIYEPDNDRDPHTHPWWFGSFVWRGAYTERVQRGGCTASAIVRAHHRWSWHVMWLSQAHLITAVSDRLVTVVLVGPRMREWGFWTDRGFRPWRLYWPAVERGRRARRSRLS